jgi:hypothetical protein
MRTKTWAFVTITALFAFGCGAKTPEPRASAPAHLASAPNVTSTAHVTSARVAAPPPPEDDAPNGLATDQVVAVIQQHMTEIRRACVDDLKTETYLQLKLRIAPDGSVSSASATGDDAAADRCLEDQAAAWRFPSAAGRTTLVLPFQFAPAAHGNGTRKAR